jgi:hypothetical protein
VNQFADEIKRGDEVYIWEHENNNQSGTLFGDERKEEISFICLTNILL